MWFYNLVRVTAVDTDVFAVGCTAKLHVAPLTSPVNEQKRSSVLADIFLYLQIGKLFKNLS